MTIPHVMLGIARLTPPSPPAGAEQNQATDQRIDPETGEITTG